ncbi:ATP-binding protein [uncultured Bacteroides sp.]|uniref:AAA family ATPase n=1 Tax=uncultured Bacteroides sp. TaxID=162156 RepID=UPI0025FEE5D0|nr:ATP-binding protein [uncultured Bacteroides sp.]
MKSLCIKNYKNLKELSLNSLAPVNLIVGRNNVGKSTLLEAISIYITNGSDEWLKTILDIRGELVNVDFAKGEIDSNKILLEHYSSLFNDHCKEFVNSTVISIGENEDLLNIRLVHVSEKTIKSEDGFETRKYVSYNDCDNVSDSQSLLYLGDGLEVSSASASKILIPFFQRRAFGSVKDKMPFEYVLVEDFQLRRNVLLFDRVSLSDEEKYVVEALRIIEPRVDRLNFLNENEFSNVRVPYVTLKDTGQRFRLSSMGDGTNRVLSIILGLVNCKGGVFLLDEFETGLHYTVQTKLWEVIFMLSEKLNIQVFVTSHSRDCINSFVAANEKKLGQIIRLDNRDGNIVAVSYDNEEDMKFIAQSNVEIR